MLDEFLSVADRSTGQEELTLGSCQVASMVGDLKLPASLFDLTLVSLFEDQAAVDRAVYRAQSDKHRLMTRWLATFFLSTERACIFLKNLDPNSASLCACLRQVDPRRFFPWTRD